MPAYKGRNEFERQILAGKIPDVEGGEPGFAYVRIPYDKMASRAEHYGRPFYHVYFAEIHVYESGNRLYHIRYKDVRRAGTPWREFNLCMKDIDDVHKWLETHTKWRMLNTLRRELWSSLREERQLLAEMRALAAQSDR